MSTRPFSAALAVAIGATALAAGLAAFTSRFAEDRSEAYFSEKAAAALAVKAGGHDWETLRSGPVLGRLVDRKGRAYYLLSIGSLGGELGAAVSVDADGEPLKAKALGSSAGSVYAKRFSSLIADIGKADRRGESPIDPILVPVFDEAFEAIAMLERRRTESRDGQ